MGKVILIEDYKNRKVLGSKDPIVYLSTFKNPKVYHYSMTCSHLSSAVVILDARLSEVTELFPDIKSCKFCLGGTT